MEQNLRLRAKYATVKIPLELAEKLDKFVADMGYRSRAEIVNDAIRRFIDEQKRLNSAVPAVEKPNQPLQLSR
ncbi:MAG TPA: ribbon-helix-helix domain-containing protein [Nitrososphaerales archaeon]|nr:ribbon-helix-helix domain-containing protein [Nitrososphaerales archaeon]